MVGRDDLEGGGGTDRDRFFRFFRPGDSVGVTWALAVVAAIFVLSASEDLGADNDDDDGADCWTLEHDSGVHIGDSGDELGDVSVTEQASNAEAEVVGEDSTESVADEEVLWREGYGTGGGGGALREANVSIRPPIESSGGPPNTDVKEGNEPGMDGVLV